MTDHADGAPRRRPGAYVVRRARLASGLVMFAFLATHLLNLSLGLVSLDALEAGLAWFQLVWFNAVAESLLLAALVVHYLLALWALHQRRILVRMRAAEAVQLATGLLIVPLLAIHFIGTYVAFNHYGVLTTYTYVVLGLWHLAPEYGAQQALAVMVAWTHGCLGIYYNVWLRPWYARAVPFLYASALLVPILALLGFAHAGREAAALAADPAWLERTLTTLRAPQPEVRARLLSLERLVVLLFLASVVATLAARALRFRLETRHGLVAITYPGGREVRIVPGTSVLEASQLHGIAHASVCGGRGRCSTCRVRVSKGADALPPATAGELAVLARVAAPPNVRLACQLRPRSPIAVAPLMPVGTGPAAGWRQAGHVGGQEREVAIMFADLRGFTALAERKLPYDVVFVLNRYFAAMGQAIEESGGHVDKFIGDGVMALFGVDAPPQVACRQALAAAKRMSEALVDLNATLTHDLERPLRLGIGVHAGPAIVGEMGYGRARSVTAIGDAVNTASRVEALTKELQVELVVSQAVADRAGIDLTGFPARDMEIRGRQDTLLVRGVPSAAELALRG